MASVKRVRAKRAARPEKVAQNAFLEALALKGVRAWRVNAGSILGSYTSKKTGKSKSWMVKGAPKGTPDTQVHIWGSVFAFIEFKRPGEALNEDQRKWHAWAKEHGVLHAVHTEAMAALLEVSVWREQHRDERERVVSDFRALASKLPLKPAPW
jgi:hypothetical protein